jgi:hypothetical protein
VKVTYGPRWQAGAGSKVTNATIWSSITANKGALESLLYGSIPQQAQITLLCPCKFFLRLLRSNVPTERKKFADTEKKD